MGACHVCTVHGADDDIINDDDGDGDYDDEKEDVGKSTPEKEIAGRLGEDGGESR
jgi:hypothetical protein